jgi:hypothetical protein
MQMIRQNHDRINGERPCRMRDTERMTKVIDMIRQQRPTPLGDSDSEKIGAARHLCAAIVRHGESIAATPSPRHQKIPNPTIRKNRTIA